MLRPKQQERKAMFAGEFATGAGTAESRAGSIDLNLVGFGTAALTLAPDRLIVMV